MSDAAPTPDPLPEPAGPQHVGIRELRHAFREYVNRAKAGERFIVTDRGEPIAELTPHVRVESIRDRLIREGLLIPAASPAGQWPEPMLLPPGAKTASELLQEERDEDYRRQEADDERFRRWKERKQ